MVEQTPVKKRRIWTPEQWQDVIKDWQSSGLSIGTYCKQQGLTSSVFRRWRRKLKMTEEYHAFIPRAVQF